MVEAYRNCNAEGRNVNRPCRNGTEDCRNGCEACRTGTVSCNGNEPEVKLSPDLEQTPRKNKMDKVRYDTIQLGNPYISIYNESNIITISIAIFNLNPPHVFIQMVKFGCLK